MSLPSVNQSQRLIAADSDQLTLIAPEGARRPGALPEQRFDVRLRRARRRSAVAARAAAKADGAPLNAPCQRSLHVEVGKHTAWLHGEDVRPLLAVAQSQRHQYDIERGAWMVPIAFADQVMVVAEWRQRRFVTCEAVDR